MRGSDNAICSRGRLCPLEERLTQQQQQEAVLTGSLSLFVSPPDYMCREDILASARADKRASSSAHSTFPPEDWRNVGGVLEERIFRN